MRPLHLHHQEKEHFKKLFQQERLDRFEDRFRILEVFLQTESHVTVDDLLERLRQSGSDFQREFVRDTLVLMCRYGFAQQNTFENEPTRYEHRHLGQHHDHMICIKCGNIIEFTDAGLERMQLDITASHNFHMLQHKMEIYGICGECRADRSESLTLDMARPGERVMIRDVIGGAAVRARLMAMGLRPGDVAEVVTNYHNGQLVIALDRKRYSFGRGMAAKIRVAPV
jgi:Fur family ferric uptake transcriptional regulator